jgi:hypothetical protein
MTAAHQDDPIAVGFAEVVAVSVPFADAFLGPLLSGRLGGYHEDHPFLLIDASHDVEETIAAALRLRGLSVLSLGVGTARLLGAEPALEETMHVAQSIEEFSVADIAQALGLTPQAANNRLKGLLRSGALTRTRVKPERGGKEFRYRVAGLEARVTSAGTDGPRRRASAAPTS